MEEINVYIIHGFMASTEDHWFRWLQNKLRQRNITVKIVNLPDSHSPEPDKWQAALRKEMNILSKNSIFIAHSLGCVTLLKYLQSSLFNDHIGGMILVSGFTEQLPSLPQLNSFVTEQIHFKKIISQVPRRIVINSDQDSIVPGHLSRELADNLSARLVTISNGGHFLSEDGYTCFPKLYNLLKKMINNIIIK
ncbi:RBBP9/YdeN family alpha/beta hydrolase [Vibrio salinus]|uniref:RBBP9/YdeN family alpha/beta hydrolase n=1 Tax=Vibrio salinus TaxID=2899784 RepID=UPI001E389115|nr:alpha/beta hydrolase [Vibrio salinus]MCE0495211.1 alpha/beta hydrolase [Vibrio salinus]